MSKTIEAFLDFENNGVNFVIDEETNEVYVPIKQVCEWLNVHYKNQFARIKQDLFLSEKVVLKKTIGKDNKRRNMTCLPLFFFYGWLVSIRTEEKNIHLHAYQLKCYDLMYRHFKKK